MMIDLDQERVYVAANMAGAERWPGDTWPAARAEERVARAALYNAWHAVADKAQQIAHAAYVVPTQYPANPGGELRSLIEAAEALAPAAAAATRAARVASDQMPPRHPKDTR
jgi:hypothetical protein